MSVISAMFDNNKYSFEHAFGVKDITSSEMKKAIRLWFDLYFAEQQPEKQDNALRLPTTIVNKITKTVFSEYKTTLQGDTQGKKAQYISALLGRINSKKKQALQCALVGGECLIKPLLTPKGLLFSIIRRDCFVPLALDEDGNLTSVGTMEVTTQGRSYYTLFEKRTALEGGDLEIESKLFVSTDPNVPGKEVLLATLPKYKTLQTKIQLKGVDGIGMAHLKTPLLNCVDGSHGGVSIYAPAVGLLERIYENEYQLDREFQNGASRIIASEDFVRRDEEMGEIPFPMPHRRREHNRDLLQDELFCLIEDGPENVGITIFSPALREQSFLARKQEYLRNLESTIGLKRGILSEAEAVERTATEITSSAGDYNLTIQDFQDMWADMVKQLLGICDTLGQIYKLCDSSPFDVESDLVMDWGDGVLFNRDRAWQEQQSMVASGMLKPELAIAWYFDLPKPETEQDLADIREKYMPQMRELTEGEE